MTLQEFEKTAPNRAKHRALIMQILDKHPEGLTTQQILGKELDCYGYTFLTDNRLRELRAMGWIESRTFELKLKNDGKEVKRKFLKWIAKGVDLG